MRLMQFVYNGQNQFGAELEDGQRVLNLSDVADTTIGFLRKTENNTELYRQVQQRVEDANTGVSSQNIVNKSVIEKLLAPVTNPDKLLCSGMNYRDHCEEQNVPIPKEPIVFNKFPSTIVGPYDDILYPKYDDITSEMDWEVEMTVVIGKTGKYIKESEVYDYIAGYTVGFDGSARDLQLKRNNGQWLLGKTLDTFCPLGPVLVTPDEIPDPHNLQLSLYVNGVQKQNSNTNQMIFKVTQMIAFYSRYFTFYPGDVILTGCPPGVGCFKNPPEYLKVGDVVETRVEKIGSIVNKIVREQ